MLTPRGADSVSYTHLDVYKRQAQEVYSSARAESKQRLSCGPVRREKHCVGFEASLRQGYVVDVLIETTH